MPLTDLLGGGGAEDDRRDRALVAQAPPVREAPPQNQCGQTGPPASPSAKHRPTQGRPMLRTDARRAGGDAARVADGRPPDRGRSAASTEARSEAEHASASRATGTPSCYKHFI